MDRPEGTWVRLDPSVNVDALVIPAWQKVIAKGLQDHGMVLRDASGSFTIWGHTPVNGGLKWSDVGLSNSGSAAFSSGFPLSRLQVLQPPPDLGGLRTPFVAAAPDPDRDGAESVD